jgi:predicted phage tail protein
MKVVKVYGALRERLGQCRFELDVATPAQAIKALCVNFPGLDKWLIDSEQDGVGYRVRVGKQQATPEDLSVLALPWSEREVFTITPVVAGAGGVGRTLLGIALIAVAVLNPVVGFSAAAGGFAVIGTATATVGTSLAIAAGTIGIGLTLSGVAQMISPTPKSGFELEEANRIQNFSFSGITNTSQQGLAVPIAYGRVVVGSAVISSGLDVDHSPSEEVTPESLALAFLLRRKG